VVWLLVSLLRGASVASLAAFKRSKDETSNPFARTAETAILLNITGITILVILQYCVALH
jgi:hypothetical protein